MVSSAISIQTKKIAFHFRSAKNYCAISPFPYPGSSKKEKGTRKKIIILPVCRRKKKINKKVKNTIGRKIKVASRNVSPPLPFQKKAINFRKENKDIRPKKGTKSKPQ